MVASKSVWDPSPWAWQPAVRAAAAAEGGDGNLQGGERHRASSQRHRRRAVCAADGGSATAPQREGFALGLRFALLHCTHSLLPPCFPRLHRAKMHALILQIKLCFLKKLLTHVVHISTLGRNMILFFPLDLSSDPCHPPLRDTGRTFLGQRRGGQLSAGLPSGTPLCRGRGALGARRGCSLPSAEAAGTPLWPPPTAMGVPHLC